MPRWGREVKHEPEFARSRPVPEQESQSCVAPNLVFPEVVEILEQLLQADKSFVTAEALHQEAMRLHHQITTGRSGLAFRRMRMLPPLLRNLVVQRLAKLGYRLQCQSEDERRFWERSRDWSMLNEERQIRSGPRSLWGLLRSLINAALINAARIVGSPES